MNDCSNHKKEVAGITDMKVLAEMIGDLHYETLRDLLEQLRIKFAYDALRDKANRKNRLADLLLNTAGDMHTAYLNIKMAWQICKPHMESDNSGNDKKE